MPLARTIAEKGDKSVNIKTTGQKKKKQKKKKQKKNTSPVY